MASVIGVSYDTTRGAFVATLSGSVVVGEEFAYNFTGISDVTPTRANRRTNSNGYSLAVFGSFGEGDTEIVWGLPATTTGTITLEVGKEGVGEIINSQTGSYTFTIQSGDNADIQTVTANSAAQSFTVDLASRLTQPTEFSVTVSDTEGSVFYNPASRQTPNISFTTDSLAYYPFSDFFDLVGNLFTITLPPGASEAVFTIQGMPAVSNNNLTFKIEETTSSFLVLLASTEAEVPQVDPAPGAAPSTGNVDTLDYSDHLDRLVIALDRISVSQAEISATQAGILNAQTTIASKLSAIDNNIDALKEAGDPRSIGDGIRVTQPYGQLYLAYLWKEILQGGFLDGYSTSVTDDDVVDLLNKLENHDNAKLINQQVKLINEFIAQIQSKFSQY